MTAQSHHLCCKPPDNSMVHLTDTVNMITSDSDRIIKLALIVSHGNRNQFGVTAVIIACIMQHLLNTTARALALVTS
jgi:hypothetical protein